MKAFIRSLTDFSNLGVLDVIEYTLPLYSAADKTGQIVVVGNSTGYNGTWCLVDGYLYFVEKSASDKGKTTLTLRKPIYGFNRSLVYSGDGNEYLEDFIASCLTSDFIGQSDAAFAMPYLTVSYTTSTFAELGYGENEVFSFLDVLKLAEEQGIGFTFTADYNSLSLAIAKRTNASHQIFFQDGHNFLVSADISTDIVSKVTARRITTTGEITVLETGDFYWHSDGTVSSTPPVPRLRGTWSVVSTDDDTLPLLDIAKEEMAGNVSKYKISFYSEKVMGLGDSVTCRINDEPVTGIITYCENQNGRRYYECGELPTTLTEKFAKATEQKQGSTSIYEKQTPSYLNSAGGTVGGELVINGETNLNGAVVVDSSSYGTTLPASGETGQIFFLI